MIATKTWTCESCGLPIKPGDRMEIRHGDFYHEGHLTGRKPEPENEKKNEKVLDNFPRR